VRPTLVVQADPLKDLFGDRGHTIDGDVSRQLAGKPRMLRLPNKRVAARRRLLGARHRIPSRNHTAAA
jgi:hypothetical protein